jgi:hypothetical protein
MGQDTCPECGEEYIKMTEVDARPGGALFEEYTHSYEDNDLWGNHVDESCTHIIEWGEESEHA